jgi:hypothetical protein
VYESPAAPLPNIPNRTATPKTGQFASAKAILGSFKKNRDIASDPNATPEARAVAARQIRRDIERAQGLGFSQQELADFYYDPKGLDYYLGDTYEGSANVFDTGQSALITDVPTSTTNYRRPRTVAAGYDVQNKIVTVIFRDGTAWNYYGVPESEWITFHQSITKGPFLRGGADPGKLLTFDGHGPADVSQLSPAAQQEFYRISRAAQVLSRDKASGNAQQNRRPKSQPNLIRRQNQQYHAKMAAKQGRSGSTRTSRGRRRTK